MGKEGTFLLILFMGAAVAGSGGDADRLHDQPSESIRSIIEEIAHQGGGWWEGGGAKLAITIPVTSRGHDVSRPVSEMRIFTSFLPSFVATATPPASIPSIHYAFYIGYDLGDPILDTHGGREAFRLTFADATGMVQCSASGRDTVAGCVSLAFLGFNYTNTLTALWNGLNELAYQEGADYVFMPNDDLKLLTPGWPEALAAELLSSPLLPNLGVTGPIDPVSGRGDMTSMPMLHRMHFEIFGPSQSLPPSLINWYNDVWLGNVYRPFGANRLARGVASRNHDGCEDPQHCSRYHLGQGAQAPWIQETAKGRLKVAEWLSAQGVPIQSVGALLNEPITLG